MQVISLIGRQGSGKTTVGRRLAKRIYAQHIEASTVVRKLHNNLRREEMYHTNEQTATNPTWLGDAVFNEINPGVQNIVVTGVREVEVHNTLVKKYDANLHTFALYADKITRFRRLKQLNKCETYEAFQTLDRREAEIGLEALLADPAIETFKTTEFTDPDEIVDMIVDLVENARAS